MGKEFETHLSAEVAASPEQVWDAIATGPGISSWFVGRTEVDGDTVRTSFGDDWIPAGTISAADPGHRFAYASDTAPDGRFVAYEYLIEGVDRSSTVLRAVTSGFLPGDDWAEEFEAMGYGTRLFFHTLVEYLRRFPGRALAPSTSFGPPVTDWPDAWSRLHARFGLGSRPQPGDRVRAELTGTVYHADPHALAIVTDAGFHRFIRGFHGSMVFSDALTTAPEGTIA
ncbi:SRPBCC domain-containing protein [Actinoplanes sp. NPDC051494]|uniref:SRPBCC domain-containing protein n=1 Tax=Actinoplanes sp. NPDC051494 TaxID=3363907 RepID=UPI00378EA54A